VEQRELPEQVQLQQPPEQQVLLVEMVVMVETLHLIHSWLFKVEVAGSVELRVAYLLLALAESLV
jgi:hypothetical protein